MCVCVCVCVYVCIAFLYSVVPCKPLDVGVTMDTGETGKGRGK